MLSEKGDRFIVEYCLDSLGLEYLVEIFCDRARQIFSVQF
jgi:hypothetical protein